jgi:hypothetical protein
MVGGHLPKRLLTIENGARDAFPHQKGPGPRIKLARINRVAVLAEAQDSVRIVADEIGTDQVVSHQNGVRRRSSRPLKDVCRNRI